MCDEEGEPISTEVFAGNTSDINTFESQVKKAAENFGCERVTFVGDRGMIKSEQIESLADSSSHIFKNIRCGPRETVRLALEEENIESRPFWKPLHLQPVFKDCRVRSGAVSENLFKLGLCLPSGTAMTEEDLKRVVDVIRDASVNKT